MTGTHAWAARLTRLIGLHTNGADVCVRLSQASVDLVFVAGALASVQPMTDSEPSLLFLDDPALVVSALTGPSTDPASLTVAAPGEPPSPPYPFDFPASTQMSIPADALRVQLYTTNTPFGLLIYWDTIVGGTLIARKPGRAEDPNAVIKQEFSDVIHSLDPNIPILEAIAGARVSARHVGILMALAGAYDGPGVRATLNWRPATNEALVRLATHTQHPAWRSHD